MWPSQDSFLWNDTGQRVTRRLAGRLLRVRLPQRDRLWMLWIHTKAHSLLNLLDKLFRAGICLLLYPTGAQHNDPRGKEKLRRRGTGSSITPALACGCIPVGIGTALRLGRYLIGGGIDHQYLRATREKGTVKEDAGRESATEAININNGAAGCKDLPGLEARERAEPLGPRRGKASLKARLHGAALEPAETALHSTPATVTPALKTANTCHAVSPSLCGGGP